MAYQRDMTSHLSRVLGLTSVSYGSKCSENLIFRGTVHNEVSAEKGPFWQDNALFAPQRLKSMFFDIFSRPGNVDFCL